MVSALGPGSGSAAVFGGAAPAATWWDLDGLIACCVAAYDAKNATSLANSYIDLSGNGNNCGPGVAPAWAAGTGWTFNGVTQWLDTGLTPGAAWSCSLTVVGSAPNVRTGATLYDIGPNYFAQVLYVNGGVRAVAPALATGTLGIAAQQGYRNGVADGAAIPAGAAPSSTFRFGARGPTIEWGGTLVAASLYSCTLTAPQMLALAVRMNTL